MKAQWHFYKDRKAGKRCYIRILSPEGEELEELIGDSDEEVVEGSKREKLLLQFFQEHAHEVDEFVPKTHC